MIDINFDLLLSNIEKEAQKAEGLRKTLFTFEGYPMHTPDEQSKWEAGFLAPVRQAVADVHELAEMVKKQAAIVMTTVDADPLANVGTEELTRMQALEPFIKDEIETMLMADLQKRLVWALNHADGPTKRLYLRHAAKRIGALGGARLVQPLRNLEDSLITPAERARRDKALQAAQEAQERANKASFAAEQRLRQADGRAAAAHAQRLRDYGGIF